MSNSSLSAETGTAKHEDPPASKKGAAIPLAPMVPVDWSINTFSRFLGSFEAFEYTGWVDESLSWKTDCYIGDWSPLLKIRVRGPDALTFFERLSTNCWPNIKSGQAKHAIFCEESSGFIVGEGLILMLDRDDILFSSCPGVSWAMYQFHSRDINATLEVVTDDWYLYQVQGPKSVALMEEIVEEKGAIHSIKFMNAKELTIDGCKFQCLRQGVSGEHGFELWGSAAEGPKVYSAIRKFGKKFGIREIGNRTKSVNHVEAAFPTPGLDFVPLFLGDTPELVKYRQYLRDSGLDFEKIFTKIAGSYGTDPRLHHRTPFDLGWGWLVNFNHDFIGKKALEKIAAAPPNKLVSILWNSEDVINVYASFFRDETYEYMEMPRLHNEIVASKVVVDGKEIGCAISRCYSYWFKQMISLGIIETKFAVADTEVLIKWGSEGKPQKMIRGVVKSAPYKEDKRRHPLQSQISWNRSRT